MKLWIARDNYGLYIFPDKPTKDKYDKNSWCTPYMEFLPISSNLFPEVTCENSPKRIILKLEEDEIVDSER